MKCLLACSVHIPALEKNNKISEHFSEPSQKYRSIDDRKHQIQEGAKIGTHSQEEPFLGSHKPKLGSPKIGRKKQEATIIGRILIGDTNKGRNNPVFLSCDFLRMVPPKNAFLSLRLPIFGASYYIFGVAPYLEVYYPRCYMHQ